MSKTFRGTLFVFFIQCCIQFGAIAQSLTINFAIPNPRTNPEEWDDYSNSIILTIQNHTDATIEVVPDIKIQSGNKVFVKTNPGTFIPLTVTPGTHTFSSDVIFPDVAIRFYNLAKGDDLPAGIYEVCGTVIPRDKKIPQPAEDCELFMIDDLLRPSRDIIFKPPIALDFDNDQMFTQSQLWQKRFHWSGLAPVPPFPVEYHFYIFQAENISSSYEAMRSTEPVLHEIVSGKDFFYLSPTNEIDTGRYFWIIQATNISGKTVGQNNGLSEPVSFRVCRYLDCAPEPIPEPEPEPILIADPAIVTYPVNLYYPLPDQLLLPDSLRFAWSGVPEKNIRYELYYSYTEPIAPDPSAFDEPHPFLFTFSDEYLAVADSISHLRDEMQMAQMQIKLWQEFLAGWEGIPASINANNKMLNQSQQWMDAVKEGLRTSKEIKKIKVPKDCKTLEPCIPAIGLVAGLDSSLPDHQSAVMDRIQCLSTQISDFERLLAIHQAGIVEAYVDWRNQLTYGHMADSSFFVAISNLFSHANTQLSRHLAGMKIDDGLVYNAAATQLRKEELCGIIGDDCIPLLNNCTRGDGLLCNQALNAYVATQVSEGKMIPEFALRIQSYLASLLSTRAGLPVEQFESAAERLQYNMQMSYQATLCLSTLYARYNTAIGEATGFFNKVVAIHETAFRHAGNQIEELAKKQETERTLGRAKLKQGLEAEISAALNKVNRESLLDACCLDSISQNIVVTIPGDDHVCARIISDVLRKNLGHKFCYLWLQVTIPCNKSEPLDFEVVVSSMPLASCWTEGIEKEILLATGNRNNEDGTASIPPIIEKPKKKKKKKEPEPEIAASPFLVDIQTLQPGGWWVVAYDNKGNIIGKSAKRALRPLVKPLGNISETIEPLRDEDTGFCLCKSMALFNGKPIDAESRLEGFSPGDQATLSVQGGCEGQCAESGNRITVWKEGSPFAQHFRGKSIRFTFREPGIYRVNAVQICEDMVCESGYWVEVKEPHPKTLDTIPNLFSGIFQDTACGDMACLEILTSPSGKDNFKSIRFNFLDLGGFAQIDIKLVSSCFSHCESKNSILWELTDPEGGIQRMEGEQFTQFVYKPGVYSLCATLTIPDCDGKQMVLSKKVLIKTK